MKHVRFFFCCLGIFLSSCFYVSLHAQENGLGVSAWQLEISEEMYADTETFFAFIEGLVRESAKKDADLVVFPEYTGVFLSLQGLALPDCLVFEDSGSPGPDFLSLLVPGRRDIRSVKDIFMYQNVEKGIQKQYVDGFSRLAESCAVHILAGTFFWVEKGQMYNRLFLFGPDGALVYTQDKVFLTPYETGIVGLSPGRVGAAAPFYIGQTEIVVSICRDTFFSDWYPVFRNAALWIDIKANGEPWDSGQEEIFSRALPARIRETEVPFGLTVCLTGEFREMVWEGYSSLIQKTEKGIEVLKKSGSVRTTGELYFQPLLSDQL